MKKLSSYIVVFMMMLTAAYSADFKASLNQNPVTQGERFTVSFSIDEQASNFRNPDFRGLQIVSELKYKQTKTDNQWGSVSILYFHLLLSCSERRNL